MNKTCRFAIFMAYQFHSDKERYFGFQYEHSRDFIVPLVKKHLDFSQKPRILEVGSAEAGVLKAFTDEGLECVGVEISAHRVELARQFMKTEMEMGLVSFFTGDIYSFQPEDLGQFDLIIMKDVIEHIHDQHRLLGFLRSLLKERGMIFITMPPWAMPFGGHQQMSNSPVLRRLPWFHLLPAPVYKGVFKLFGEKKENIEGFLDMKETGLSIQRFQRLAKLNGFKILQRDLYLINPTYKYKFNAKPRKQNALVAGIPWVRDLFTTSAYYLIGL